MKKSTLHVMRLSISGETAMADTNPDLLPCPFCGGPGWLKRSTHKGVEYSNVACQKFDCPASNTTSPPQSATTAIRAWNTRAGAAGQEQQP